MKASEILEEMIKDVFTNTKQVFNRTIPVTMPARTRRFLTIVLQYKRGNFMIPSDRLGPRDSSAPNIRSLSLKSCNSLMLQKSDPNIFLMVSNPIWYK